MLFFTYLLFLVLLSLIVRKKTEEFRHIILLIYNYIAGILLHVFIFLPSHHTGYELVRMFLMGILKSADYMSLDFEDTLNNSNAQEIAIFIVICACTVHLIIELFFKKLYLILKLTIRKWRAKEVIIVKGKQEDANALINNIYEHNKKIMIYYLTDLTKQPMMEALILNESKLEHVLANNHTTVVLLPDDFNENFVTLKRFDELGKKYKIKVTAYISNNLLRLESFTFENIDTYIISEEFILSQDFIQKYLPLQQLINKKEYVIKDHMYLPEHPYQCLMIGFSNLHKEFLLSLYENTGFNTVNTQNGLDIAVVDYKNDNDVIDFYQDFPSLKQDVSIHFENMKHDKIYEYIQQNIHTLNCILVDVGDTEKNIETIMRVLRVFKKCDIQRKTLLSVALYDNNNGSVALLSGEDNILFQQINNKQYTYDNLISRKADHDAFELNEHYRSLNPNGKKWNELDTFTKASNRAAVLDYPNKDLLSEQYNQLNEEEKKQLCWKLAYYEHTRWNHFHYAHGWTKLDMSELTEEERTKLISKRRGSKKHICLVDFDELDKLPQQYPGYFKDNDYNNIVDYLKSK